MMHGLTNLKNLLTLANGTKDNPTNPQ